MTCKPTNTPAPFALDIAALREKYRIERDKRLHKDGQQQYIRPTGDIAPNYLVDPHQAVAARAPMSTAARRNGLRTV